MTERTDFASDVSGIASLREPRRRELYQYVANSSQSVGRDEVATALGLSRAAAAFHLDRLVTDGLLSVEFRRLGGRRGPGAGRPSKLYRRVSRDVSVSLPPRDYELVAELLAQAITSASLDGHPVRDVVSAVAHRRGAAIAASARSATGAPASTVTPPGRLMELLTDLGFEPRLVDGYVALSNCPFRSLTGSFTELICALNLDLLTGITDSTLDGAMEARLVPAAGSCCVRLYPTRPSAAPTAYPRNHRGAVNRAQ